MTQKIDYQNALQNLAKRQIIENKARWNNYDVSDADELRLRRMNESLEESLEYEKTRPIDYEEIEVVKVFNKIYGVDARNGKQIWEWDTYPCSRIETNNKNVFTTDGDILCVLDKRIGARIDKKMMHGFITDIKLDGQRIYVATEYEISAMESGSLFQNWEKKIKHTSNIGVFENELFIGGGEGLFCLDKNSGQELWREHTPAGPMVVDENGDIYSINYYRDKLNIFTRNGKQILSKDLPEIDIFELAVGTNLYAISKFDSVIGMNKYNGNVLWQQRISHPLHSICEKDSLEVRTYLFEGGERVYHLNPHTGEILGFSK